ncbi:MAG: hypothetical protein CR990_00065 [Desulfococcus sp.]|nr:MAG: hypothetical protein CR990_00065 [Desulfococcus sp.]
MTGDAPPAAKEIMTSDKEGCQVVEISDGSGYNKNLQVEIRRENIWRKNKTDRFGRPLRKTARPHFP